MPQPIAYFITWTTYGSWLRGDERGWVRLASDGTTTHESSDPALRAHDSSLLKHPPVLLTPDMRLVVEDGVRRVCDRRGWVLHAVNARSNHVHVVVSSSRAMDPTLVALKAWATRALREAELAGPDHRLWTRHGSTKSIHTHATLAAAVDYVVRMQEAGSGRFGRGEPGAGASGLKGESEPGAGASGFKGAAEEGTR